MSDADYALRQLNETISSFQERLNEPVNKVYQSSNNVNESATRIYQGIEKFQQSMMRSEESQLAHENIIRIDQLLKEQFANHETIRKTVLGIVRDFDINLVRNSTIQELSEELWISSSRYWLSYALIAITAWVNNYPEVARNALAEAGRRDSIKTTLFFCLMNLRFERIDAAKKWFCEYIKVLDPKMLQQETSVLLQAFLNGIFGKDKELEHEVLSLIDEWMQILNDDAEACEALIESYFIYFSNLRSPAEYNYPAIAEFCKNNDAIRKSFEDVSKYDALLNFVESLNVESVEQNDENYKARTDAVLMSLISRYDAEELNLKNQRAMYQFIVDNEGDKNRAAAQYQQYQDLQGATFNIGKQMMRWALFDTDDRTDIQVRKFGFQNTQKWFSEAVAQWDIKLQQEKPVNYDLAIDTWTGVSNGEDQAEMQERLRDYFESNKFQNMFINTFNIALALAFILSFGFAIGLAVAGTLSGLYLLVVTAVSAGLLTYRCLKAIKEYPLRVNQAVKNLNLVMAEIAEFRQYFDEKRMEKERLLSVSSLL